MSFTEALELLFVKLEWRDDVLSKGKTVITAD
jgi:hypothetical protein